MPVLFVREELTFPNYVTLPSQLSETDRPDPLMVMLLKESDVYDTVQHFLQMTFTS